VPDMAVYKKAANQKPKIQIKGPGKQLRETNVITILNNITPIRSILADRFIFSKN
jgi:hypothetical protein